MIFKNRKGTSLIEAAVAIALIGIMLLWAARLYSNSLKNTGTTSDIETATHLASDKIEHLKTLSKDSISSISTSSTIVQFPSPYQKFGYKYFVPKTIPGTSGMKNPPPKNQRNGVYIKYIEVDIYLMSNTSKPIITMGCNFLRKDSDGTNIGT